MTHDLLRNVIQDLKAIGAEGGRLRPAGEHVLRAHLPVARTATRWRSTRGRATPSRWRCGRGRRSSSRTRSSTTPRRSISPPTRPTPIGCTSGSRASIRTTWANTRCSARSLRIVLANLDPERQSDPSDHCVHPRLRRFPDDRRHRQSERRASGKTTTAINLAAALALRGKRDAAHRPRPPGQQHDVVPRHAAGDAQRLRRDCRPGGCRWQDVILPSPLREPVDRAVADRAGQARSEAGRGDGRAFPAEGQDRAAPEGRIRTSSSTARRRSGC